MTDAELSIRGGSGGTVARTEDLAHAARALQSAAEDLDFIVLVCRRAAERFSPWSLGVREPMPFATPSYRERPSAPDAIAALDDVVAGPFGAVAAAREIERIADALRETVDILEGAESLVGRAFGFLQDLGGRLWGVAECGVWVLRTGVGGALSLTADAGRSVGFGDGASGAFFNVLDASGDFIDPDEAFPITEVLDGPAMETILGAGSWQLAAMTPGGLLLIAASGKRSGTGLLSATLGQVTGALDEILGNPHGTVVTPIASRAVVPPRGVEDIVRRSAAPRAVTEGAGTLAIEKIVYPDGTRAWIVEIPGTQDWTPNGGQNPFDITANLLLVGNEPQGLSPVVLDAMRSSGIPADEPVMLVGHSQGGLVALDLITDPAVMERYDVRSVVTVGSPVGLNDPPDSVAILSLEHEEDIVWALDGTLNPDTPSWVTVRRELRASADPADVLAAQTFVGAHDTETYAATARLVDRSGESSIQGWRESSSLFMPGEGATSTRTVFEAVRGIDEAPGQSGYSRGSRLVTTI